MCRVLRLQAGHKYCLLGRLSKEVGWNHYDTIKVSRFTDLCFFFFKWIVPFAICDQKCG